MQLCLLTTAGAFRPLYRPLPTGDVTLSADRRLLAYRDTSYRLHLVRLPGGADTAIGRGVLPHFSPDGRYLAFVTSDTLPVPSRTERLMVYDLATGSRTRIGPAALPRAGFSSPITLYTWAPHADMLAWQPDPGRPRVAVVSIGHLATGRTITLPNGGTSSELAWSGDGRGLLYWRSVRSGSTTGARAPRFSLLRRRLPNGPAETIAASVPTAWSEGLAPAPASDAAGTLFASLLGAPRGGLNQIILYARGRAPRTVPLPGEPRLVSFAPRGAQCVAIWTPPYGRGFGAHAALVDAATGRARELGSAVAAFWTGGTTP